MVLECTGAFLTRAALQPYFDAGVKKVVVSAPVKDPNPVLNVVVGCNEGLYDAAKDHIVTAASCTTNCLAPVVKVRRRRRRRRGWCCCRCARRCRGPCSKGAPAGWLAARRWRGPLCNSPAWGRCRSSTRRSASHTAASPPSTT